MADQAIQYERVYAGSGSLHLMLPESSEELPALPASLVSSLDRKKPFQEDLEAGIAGYASEADLKRLASSGSSASGALSDGGTELSPLGPSKLKQSSNAADLPGKGLPTAVPPSYYGYTRLFFSKRRNRTYTAVLAAAAVLLATIFGVWLGLHAAHSRHVRHVHERQEELRHEHPLVLPEDTPSQYHRFVYQIPSLVSDAADFSMANVDQDQMYTHMGMLATLPNGSVVATWQGSVLPSEGNFAQRIYWSVSDNQGLNWTAPRRPLPDFFTATGQYAAMWGPVLHVQDGRVYLFFSSSRDECRFNHGDWKWNLFRHSVGGDIRVMTSDDSGETWSKHRVIYSMNAEGGIAKMTANTLGIGPSGEWLLPFWRENSDPTWMDFPFACTSNPRLHGVAAVLVSYDKGLTWNVTGNINVAEGERATWLIEAAIAPLGASYPPPPAAPNYTAVLVNASASHSLSGAPAPGLLPAAPGAATSTRLALSPGLVSASSVSQPQQQSAAPSMMPAMTSSMRWLQVFRTFRGVPMYGSVSNDGGHTWGPAAPLPLPNPDTKVHMAVISNGLIVLAYNNDLQRRNPLTLAASSDGATWHNVAVVEDHPAGQFSYPTVHYVAAERRIMVVYTTLYFQPEWADWLKTQANATTISTSVAANGTSVNGTTVNGTMLAPAAAPTAIPKSGMKVFVITEAALMDGYNSALNGTSKLELPLQGPY